MNPLHVLRDAWYFFSHNLLAIARLCLPLIVLEALLQQQVVAAVAPEARTLYRILTGLLFYPLYTGALILFLDARSSGQAPALRNLLAVSLRLWPAFALLAGLSTLAILLGASLFVLPGLWLMIKLAFAEYLLVLRGLGPMRALHESFEMTSGYFWPMLLCVLGVALPLWLLDGWLQEHQGESADMLLDLALNSLNGFLQLFSTVVVFRLFMLRSALPERG
nr:YciC family protein [uncultured Pseudomonas sp.]